jgi:hypothetical protein
MIASFRLLSFENESESDSTFPGVDIRDAEKLTLNIPREQLPRIKQKLDHTFFLYRRFKEMPPSSPKKMLEALGTLFSAAKRLEDLLKDPQVRGELACALAEALSAERGDDPDDPDRRAGSILHRNRQGVSQLVQLADHARRKWENGPPIQVEIRTIPSPTGSGFSAEIVPCNEPQKRSASKPEVSVIVGAIYTIWEGYLGRSPRPQNRKSLSPEFVTFAERVFLLNGEDFTKRRNALLKRLKDPAHNKFVFDQTIRKNNDLNFR